MEAGDHQMETTSSAASWIGGWEGGGDDDVRRCVLTTDTSSVATVLCGLSWMVKVEEMLSVIHPLSDVSIVTGDGWRRCILCCPLLPITKAGCGMMEERTSGPLL